MLLDPPGPIPSRRAGPSAPKFNAGGRTELTVPMVDARPLRTCATGCTVLTTWEAWASHTSVLEGGQAATAHSPAFGQQCS